MSRSKTLRRELKNQVRDEFYQAEENNKKIQHHVMETVRNWDFDNYVNDSSLLPVALRNMAAGRGLFEKLDRRSKATREKVAALIDGRMSPNITYNESDQSPVKGDKTLILQQDLGSGLDYNPLNPHLSEWLKTLYRGDYDKFLKFLLGLPEKEVKVLLSKRESLYNVPAVFHPISGATMLYSNAPYAENHQNGFREQIDAKDGHFKILIKLLSLGVDVNARDIGGRTPLHLIFQGHSNNSVTRKMAESLIRAGADVNARSRCGETALYQSAMDSNISNVQFLLANGADPNIKTNDGHSIYAASPPCIQNVLGEFEKRRAMEERKMSREAVGGSFRQCGVCGVGVGEKIMKRCSGRILLHAF